MKSVPTRRPKKSARLIRQETTAATTVNVKASFPIIGIGASAGGLEALEQLLAHVPADCGMAFIIVQHLDPTHKGIMPELLQRVTGMTVFQVKDRTEVHPNRVYVIPPNKDMSILHGILHLFTPSEPHGLRLPIDFFLRSLAQDRMERSIGIILSGMGSDGTLGLRAIKEKAGLALAQEPSTAKFDGMPSSAVNAGLVDIVAPVDELPGKIIAYLQRAPLIVKSVTAAVDDKSRNILEKVVILLRSHSGHDFSLYKKNTLYRRIERRMGIHQIGKMATYVRYLQENPQELDLLFKELLIGVTNFFRDPAAWEQLRLTVLPVLLASRTSDQALRAWVPGCSTGEEAYSLAIMLKEVAEALRPRVRFAIQVFATDLDKDAISKARQGLFSDTITADVSKDRLCRFFAKEEHGYRVRKEIREMVIFAPQDLIMDPPFTKLDILSCRNVLIYLTPEVQKKLIPLFHFSLKPGGVLFLGSAESIGNATNLFAPLNGKSRIFHRTECAGPLRPVEFPSSFSAAPYLGTETRPATIPSVSLQTQAEQLILQHYAPPAVLTNDNGDILYISGRTGKYLEPAAGKANWNFFAMVREGLRYELTDAFQKTIRDKERVTMNGLKIGTNGDTRFVNVTLQRLDGPGALQGLVMIVFADVAASAESQTEKTTPKTQTRSKQLTELEQELVRVRGEARTLHEEMQTSQEELRSANEELQSTNEELQSTNEELTTSKEEMQSMNEELQTVNAELQGKVDELMRASNDMKNLLDSTDIATLFLDKDLNVRRFTSLATKIIKLIPGDLGRPITDLSSDLFYPELAKDAKDVLRTLVPSEKAISARGNRWFTVRIMPYRTLDDRIDGVVITFTNITISKTLEAKLREQQAVLKTHVAVQDAKLTQKKKNAKS